jgi:hypothetical protein
LLEEGEKSVLHKVCDTVSELAAELLDRNEWPELLPALQVRTGAVSGGGVSGRWLQSWDLDRVAEAAALLLRRGGGRGRGSHGVRGVTANLSAAAAAESAASPNTATVSAASTLH